MQPKADVDFEPGVVSVGFIPLRAPLKGFFVLFKPLFEALDVLGNDCSLTIVVVFPGLDCDTQQLADASEGD